MKLWLTLAWTGLLLGSTSVVAKPELSRLQLPAGYEVSLFADNVVNARQMAVSKQGIVYVGSRKAGKVHALVDFNKDGVADKTILLAEGLNMPSGLAIKDGDLYVAEVNRILRFKQVDKQLNKPEYEVFFDKLPDKAHHGWKFIRFAPSGELIIPIGVPCNVCKEEAPFGEILALDMNTKTLTTWAKGVRNSVGFDFHPQTQGFWFSDNGRDMMGDDIPPDEINRLGDIGEHFGFPYIHAGSIADPEFNQGRSAAEFVPPKLALGAHVAPLGIHFYRGKAFPSEMKNKLFVAEHGSWNRSKKSGYRVMVATVRDGLITAYEPFVTGFMANEQTYGRPVAFAELDDGSLLVSDDFADAIYRITYTQKP
ncbi:PQQ-dependent sugar dehydrogenase [Pseudoalteromonas fenneropenaei]|uniref:PQQ-dependent sugar dehydrogenase n=1 Tax=Pseudoalteromonas fenneropenaei TaxID=1737459 RepID=A0ABV7CH87_9GAMM